MLLAKLRTASKLALQNSKSFSAVPSNSRRLKTVDGRRIAFTLVGGSFNAKHVAEVTDHADADNPVVIRIDEHGKHHLPSSRRPATGPRR